MDIHFEFLHLVNNSMTLHPSPNNEVVGEQRKNKCSVLFYVFEKEFGVPETALKKSQRRDSVPPVIFYIHYA